MTGRPGRAHRLGSVHRLGRSRRLGRAQRRAVVLGAIGFALVVTGIVVVLATAPGPMVGYSGSYEPLACTPWPDCGPGDVPGAGWSAVLVRGTVAGLGVAVLGSLLLAGVAGWLLGSDSRADQR